MSKIYMAKGSLAELQTQIQIAHEVVYVKKDIYEKIEAKCNVIGKMIGKLIKARKAP
jgi:four helix bundle protein